MEERRNVGVDSLGFEDFSLGKPSVIFYYAESVKLLVCAHRVHRSCRCQTLYGLKVSMPGDLISGEVISPVQHDPLDL